MTNYSDGDNFRPIDHTAYEGDRPFDQFLLGVSQNDLKHVAKRGSQCCVDGLIGDDVTDETAENNRHQYASSSATSREPLRGIFVFPYLFQPGLKRIEFDLWCRISRFDVDDSGNLPSTTPAMEVAVRAIAGGIQPKDGEAVQSNVLEAEISGTNGSANAHWQYETFGYDFERSLKRSASWGLLTVEIASQGQDIEVKSDTESQTSNTNRTDQKMWGSWGDGLNNMYGEVWMQDSEDIKVQAQPLEMDAGNGTTSGVGPNFITEFPNRELQGPGDATFEWRQYAIPFMEVRGLNLRETFYTPDRIEAPDDIRSRTPPTSSKVRRWAQLAQDLYRRAELIFADPTYRNDDRGSDGQKIKHMVTTPHEPCEIILKAVFLRTAVTDRQFEADGDWQQMGEQGPSADADLTLTLHDHTGTTIDSVTSTSTEPYYGADQSGHIPFLQHLNRFGSSPSPQYLNIDNGRFLGKGAGSGNPSNLDIREIRIPLDAADYDFRTGLELFLEWPLPQNISYPNSGPFSDASDVTLDDHLLGYSLWSRPR